MNLLRVGHIIVNLDRVAYFQATPYGIAVYLDIGQGQKLEFINEEADVVRQWLAAQDTSGSSTSPRKLGNG